MTGYNEQKRWRVLCTVPKPVIDEHSCNADRSRQARGPSGTQAPAFDQLHPSRPGDPRAEKNASAYSHQVPGLVATVKECVSGERCGV